MLPEKRIDYKKKNIKRQTVWNYIRRNPIFRAGEIMMVCEISYSYFVSYLRFLEKAKYVKIVSIKTKIFSAREYKLIKNTGPIAPLASKNTLFDYNTKEEFNFSNPDEKSRKIEIPTTLMNILKNVNLDEITKDEILEKANITAAALAKYWVRLQKMGVVLGLIEINKQHPTLYYNMKYKKRNKKFVYAYDLKRAKVVMKAIENGAYLKKVPQMRELWIKQ